MKKMKFFAYLFIGSLLLFCLGCQGAPKGQEAAEKGELFISAAASLTDAIKEIGALYEQESQGQKLVYNFGSSGALEAQIRQGAPADIFISAAQKQMDALEKEDLIVKPTRVDLLVNKVVLITAKGSGAPIKGFEDVAKVGHIALGEPQGVPVGQYAQQIFTYLKMLPEVKAKAVYGADVRQVLAWVENKEAEVGVVYATDAAVSGKVDVICEAPEGSHMPVVYPAAVLKNGKQRKAAEEFMAFLQTQKARDIFIKYGFAVK